MLTIQRYEARALPQDMRNGRLTYGVFDTFTQEFLTIEIDTSVTTQALTKPHALLAVRDANRWYDKGCNTFTLPTTPLPTSTYIQTMDADTGSGVDIFRPGRRRQSY